MRERLLTAAAYGLLLFVYARYWYNEGYEDGLIDMRFFIKTTLNELRGKEALKWATRAPGATAPGSSETTGTPPSARPAGHAEGPERSN